MWFQLNAETVIALWDQFFREASSLREVDLCRRKRFLRVMKSAGLGGKRDQFQLFRIRQYSIYNDDCPDSFQTNSMLEYQLQVAMANIITNARSMTSQFVTK